MSGCLRRLPAIRSWARWVRSTRGHATLICPVSGKGGYVGAGSALMRTIIPVAPNGAGSRFDATAGAVPWAALLRQKGEHMKGLRRSCVTRPLWSAVLTGGILLTCPAPAAAQPTPVPAPGLYRWITPPPDQQLKADTTPVPSGSGAVFVPAMSNGIDEPETLVYQGTQRVASGLNGSRIILAPGDYVLRIGSGPLDQMMSVPVSVTAGNTTLVPVVWSGIMVEVVDRNNVPHRGSYELIQVSDRQPYTIGFGADTLLGERIRTILLAPGLYRIVRPGANYRARTDFSTVDVPAASMVYFKLVLDPDDGRLLGGGVVPPEELGIVSGPSPWTRRVTVGLGLPIASTENVVGATNQTSIGADMTFDTYVIYNKDKNYWSTIFEVEQGFDSHRSSGHRGAAPPEDDRSRAVRHDLHEVLEFVRRALRALRPAHELLRVQRAGDRTDDRHEAVPRRHHDRRLPRSQRGLQGGGPFAPVLLREGAGSTSACFALGCRHSTGASVSASVRADSAVRSSRTAPGPTC